MTTYIREKKCCVLIPYYESGNALLSSLDSLSSEVIDFDILIVDDGSRKVIAKDVVAKYTGARRVSVITLESNQGIEYALNRGLKEIYHDYEYIARLDCGDKCINSRLEKQLRFLDNNKDVVMLGSWVDYVDMKGEFLFTLKHPCEHADIRRKMYINSPFVHPSVIFRAVVFDKVGFYPVGYSSAEDYALFYKIVKNFKTANFPESLLLYEVNPKSISSLKRKKQIKSRLKIMRDNMDTSVLAFYGIFRSYLLLLMPRTVSVYLNKIKSKFI